MLFECLLLCSCVIECVCSKMEDLDDDGLRYVLKLRWCRSGPTLSQLPFGIWSLTAIFLQPEDGFAARVSQPAALSPRSTMFACVIVASIRRWYAVLRLRDD